MPETSPNGQTEEFVPRPNPQPSEPMFGLGGRAALVVGGGGPLGRAAAGALAEAGADVAVASLRAGAGEVMRVNSVANEVWSLGRGNLAITLDAADPVSVEAAVGRVLNEWGRIDILANAGDAVQAAPIEQIEPADWQRAVEANLLAPTLCCRAVGRHMRLAGYGRIINIASVLASRGMANTTAYAAAQAGVLGLTRALAQEWARTGITVNAVQVGFYEGQRGFGDDPQRAAQLARMLPARALIEPADVGAAVVALAADSGFITGEVIAVDAAAGARV